MSRDDYYVIAYKILAYLYVQLKQGRDIDPEMISYNSKLLNINERYWTYIIENLVDQGYIEHVVFGDFGEWERKVMDMSACRITPAGIEYLCENRTIEKAKRFLKDAKEITPFI